MAIPGNIDNWRRTYWPSCVFEVADALTMNTIGPCLRRGMALLHVKVDHMGSWRQNCSRWVAESRRGMIRRARHGVLMGLAVLFLARIMESTCCAD